MRIQDETLGRLTNEDGLAIERSITPRVQQVRIDLISALGEEFRVRLAQTTLLGFDPGGIMQVPAPVTPAELWDYYRRKRTELVVEMLPYPRFQVYRPSQGQADRGGIDQALRRAQKRRICAAKRYSRLQTVPPRQTGMGCGQSGFPALPQKRPGSG